MREYTIPRPSEPFSQPSGLPSPTWYNFLKSRMAGSAAENYDAQIRDIAERLEELEKGESAEFTIQGLGSIAVYGSPAGGAVQIELIGDAFDPGPTVFYGTGPDRSKGLFRLYDGIITPADGVARTDSGYTVLGEVSTPQDLPLTGEAGQAWRVVDESTGLYAWDGAAFVEDEDANGVVGIVAADDLAAIEALPGVGLAVRTADEEWATRTLADSANIQWVNADGVTGDPQPDLTEIEPVDGGSILRLGFDGNGRRTQEAEATTDDLPEGADNLYFTDARTDARIAVQKGQPLGLATLDANSKLDPGQLPALAITETFVVNTQASMLALVAQQGDVAVRSDQQKSYILLAEPASTLANWQELLVPTGVGVASFNGRTGSVVPATGDYTAAQVGADALGTSAAAISAHEAGADPHPQYINFQRARALTALRA